MSRFKTWEGHATKGVVIMEITLKIQIRTDGASEDQTRNLPEEIRYTVESMLSSVYPDPRVELVNTEA